MSRRVLFAFACLCLTSLASAEVALSSVERALPTFELDALDGPSWSAERIVGQPTVVNFWATWCPPCVEEMPAMNALWQRLDGKGVQMLAINAGEGEVAIRQFLEKVEVDFPILLGDGTSTLPNWSVRGLPTTLIIDADGQVVFEALGPREWNDDALVRQLLEMR